MTQAIRLVTLMAKSSILVGGQAVIEGVMMRVPGGYATAVRRQDGSISVDRHEHTPLAERFSFGKAPLIRGMLSLFEAMKIGFQSLQWSADRMMEDEGEAPEEAGGKIGSILTTTLGVALGLGLFMVLPLWLTTRLFQIEQEMFAFNLMAGGLRILFFLLYLIAIAQMNDVRRLFQYHGAEHKTIFTFESGAEVTPARAAENPRFHPRCGTSFLFIVLLSAILVYALLDSLAFLVLGELTLGMRLVFHLAFLPLVAGAGYEVIKLTSANIDRLFFRALAQPGLWLQRITTGEPDRDQLEVAITALQSAFGERYEEYAGREYVAEAMA